MAEEKKVLTMDEMMDKFRDITQGLGVDAQAK